MQGIFCTNIGCNYGKLKFTINKGNFMNILYTLRTSIMLYMHLRMSKYSLFLCVVTFYDKYKTLIVINYYLSIITIRFQTISTHIFQLTHFRSLAHIKIHEANSLQSTFNKPPESLLLVPQFFFTSSPSFGNQHKLFIVITEINYSPSP